LARSSLPRGAPVERAALDPELGPLPRRPIAALAGLGPIARDRGKRLGPRSIGGGRLIERTVLSLAALQVSRRGALFQDFRRRLQAGGKTGTAAIVATARKLLVVLNAMLASGADFRQPPTA
jgi:transposase